LHAEKIWVLNFVGRQENSKTWIAHNAEIDQMLMDQANKRKFQKNYMSYKVGNKIFDWRWWRPDIKKMNNNAVRKDFREPGRRGELTQISLNYNLFVDLHKK
jgi:hypothetical protein